MIKSSCLCVCQQGNGTFVDLLSSNMESGRQDEQQTQALAEAAAEKDATVETRQESAESISTDVIPESQSAAPSDDAVTSSSSTDSSSEDTSSELSATSDASITPAATESADAPAVVSYPLCPGLKDDHIPCLDNTAAIKRLKTTSHYEHRERHCPAVDETPKCVLPLPEGYQPHIKWPESRDQVRGRGRGEASSSQSGASSIHVNSFRDMRGRVKKLLVDGGEGEGGGGGAHWVTHC